MKTCTFGHFAIAYLMCAIGAVIAVNAGLSLWIAIPGVWIAGPLVGLWLSWMSHRMGKKRPLENRDRTLAPRHSDALALSGKRA